jgi:phosphohistidine swiveling domain-containing protein
MELRTTSDLPLDEAKRLRSRSADFVLASTNVDEDPHFSTLYLETTLSPPPAEWGIDGWYEELVAFNYQAIERYYLRRADCELASSSMTDLVLRDPRVLSSLLHEIERRSGLLDTAFPFGWLDSRPDTYDRDELITLYERHLALHQHLYAVARLPEALDRGTGAYTARLQDLIATRAGGSAPGDALAILSVVDRPSIFREEQIEFVDLVDSLGEHERMSVSRARSGALALMSLMPSTNARLKAHRNRWAPLFYHGYSSREPVTLIDLAARMRQVVRRERALVLPERPTTARRDELVRSLALTAEEAAHFHGYGMLGWTKARRRWFQLRNFQRLDLLMERLAVHLDCPEWDLRVLLPQELLGWLHGGERPEAQIRERADGTIFWYTASDLKVGGLDEDTAFPPAVDPAAEALRGAGMVAGRVHGTCVLATRGGSPIDSDVAGPAILVVTQLDSDLVWMLPFFDGLVVEESGASAHVSMIAREIGIPTIAGVTDATRLLRAGQQVTIDGTAGTVVAAEGRA